jgi:uncharacterized repeat protein (TIGR04138 family)
MQSIDFEDLVEKLVQKNPRYPAPAYFFLKEALLYGQKKLVEKKEAARHLSGQELLEGIRQYALSQFGPMAYTVFEEWGIRDCEDFGRMVFIMVENNLLRTTENDSIDDFKGGYSFEEAFRDPFVPASKRSKTLLDRGAQPIAEQDKVGN